MPPRSEHDLLGTRPIPPDAYYGIHTLRAVENFQITGRAINCFPDLIWGIAAVKKAAAIANRRLDLLAPDIADAIVAACDDILAGTLHDQFVVDVIQGGAGTSTNMNANEVIANRALERLGKNRGDYHVIHPIEHVNMSQSTNDAYPTAVKVGLDRCLQSLQQSLAELERAFARKSLEFQDIIKIGRTQLQDAVPMALGQEFGTYAIMLREDQERLRETALLLAEVNLGGTAIGTQINAHPQYSALACAELSRVTGMPIEPAHDLIESTQDVGVFVQLSGVLKRTALKLSKVCNDLRLMSSGPRAGLNEINLPAVQAGSSIMPGKVNPVIPEVVNQVAFKVAGNDVAISFAAEAGQFQLNAFEPIIATCLFDSIAHMSAAAHTLTTRCVADITANTKTLEQYVEGSLGIVTALNPYIGYSVSSDIAAEALRSGRTVVELVMERGLLGAEDIDEILRPARLARSTEHRG